MTDTTAPRRRAPERRRRDILDAASRLFWERGFDATTVQHIAEAAGVAAGTVYLYFPSKEHVLLAMHDDFHAGMVATLQEITTLALADPEAYDLGAGIDAIIDGVVGFLLERPQETTVICRYLPRVHDDAGHGWEEAARLLADALRISTADGRMHVSDPDMAAQLLTAAIRQPLFDAVLHETPEVIPRIAAAAKELFRKALAPPGVSD